MLGRLLAVILGIGGGLVGSQAPGFTLQYIQNLQGRIDELTPIVQEYDADVARYGYTRETALIECGAASGLLDALCAGYETTITRYLDLTAHMAAIEAAGEFAKPLIVLRDRKQDIAESVMSKFEPAVPTTLVGGAYAGGGFGVSWGLSSFLFGMLGAMTGGRRLA